MGCVGLLKWNGKGRKVDERSGEKGEKEGGMEGAEGQQEPREERREKKVGWSKKKILERPGEEEREIEMTIYSSLLAALHLPLSPSFLGCRSSCFSLAPFLTSLLL